MMAVSPLERSVRRGREAPTPDRWLNAAVIAVFAASGSAVVALTILTEAGPKGGWMPLHPWVGAAEPESTVLLRSTSRRHHTPALEATAQLAAVTLVPPVKVSRWNWN